MKIVLVSDFKLKTGYFSLGVSIATELSSLGHDVVVIGIGYDQGIEHYYPFSLNPTSVEFTPQQLIKMDEVYHFDWTLFLMDIPKQIGMFHNIEKNKPGWLAAKQTASLFPVESAPFYKGWVTELKKYTKLRFTFSEFGKRECEKSGLSVHALPYGPSPFWYGKVDTQILDHPYVLTVAANQVRKNIPTAMEITCRVMHKLPDLDLVHVVVTDIDSKDGWDLIDQASRIGFEEGSFALLDRMMISDTRLRELYSRASVFLLTSVSEGIGLPIYEAQAQGCPAIATDCCAIPEAVKDAERLIKVAHQTPQPWGNTTHYWPSINDGVAKLKDLLLSNKRVEVAYPPTEAMTRKLNAVLETADSMLKVRNVTQ